VTTVAKTGNSLQDSYCGITETCDGILADYLDRKSADEGEAKSCSGGLDSNKIPCCGLQVLGDQALEGLFEAEKKVDEDSLYEAERDEYLARFYLFGHLHTPGFHCNKETLANHLRFLLENPAKPGVEPYNQERFLRYWKQNVANVLEEIAC